MSFGCAVSSLGEKVLLVKNDKNYKNGQIFILSFPQVLFYILLLAVAFPQYTKIQGDEMF